MFENIHKVVGRKAAIATSAAIMVIAGMVSTNAQSPAAGYHVTICHRTGSASNPYIIISPDVEGVVEGHLDHEQTGNGLGGDIIPSFTYKGETYSKNLDTVFPNGITGAMVAANGCNIPNEPTPTPTVPPPPTSPTPPAPVPEPMTIIMFGTGLASIGMAARRRFGRKNTDEGMKSE